MAVVVWILAAVVLLEYAYWAQRVHDASKQWARPRRRPGCTAAKVARGHISVEMQLP